MTGPGFPDEAFEFYEGLLADNSRAYWQAHRQVYDDCVRAPMVALLAALEPEFGPGHVYRPYRDLRFSADKTPYKDHQGGYVDAGGGCGYYVQVSADGLLVAGGCHSPTPDQLRRYRAALDDDRGGAGLERVRDGLERAGFTFGGSPLATRPRGFGADHPRLELLRLRRLHAWAALGVPAWAAAPRVADEVGARWRALQPLGDWLAAEVGPPRDGHE